MFKWRRRHGCNCSPIPHDGESYFLGVGDIYYGFVKTIHSEHGGEPCWSAEVRLDTRVMTGMSGGGMTRDQAMDFVERTIIHCAKQIVAASKMTMGVRVIKDSTDPVGD